ncbi:excinuclease ABC subunit C, partial [bacterium]|nr:excinuclease ABC subunit C [bacterium]
MTTKMVRDKLSALPATPGVYLMKDARGGIIYVGKAKGLKSRVSSYFQKQQFSMKTAALVREITDFEIILTGTEVEALLLERTLIKHHKPRFNILLRDDKEYPYLRVDFNEPWPRVEKVRRRKDDGATYLGPFGSAGNLRIMLAAVYKIFPLIRCTRHEFNTVKRPCNYYHMKLCLGPCTLPVDREVYVATVRDAVAFLQGKNRELVRQLKEKMLAASDSENYELAAGYRDQLKAFEKITEKQSVVVGEDMDADAIGYVANDQNTSFHVVVVREGKVIGSDSFTMETAANGDAEAMTEFLLQYYDGRSSPPELLLPFAMEDALEGAGDMGNVLATKVLFPQRGIRRQLVEIADKNAAFNLGEAFHDNRKRETELEILKDKLRLPALPRRME